MHVKLLVSRHALSSHLTTPSTCGRHHAFEVWWIIHELIRVSCGYVGHLSSTNILFLPCTTVDGSITLNDSMEVFVVIHAFFICIIFHVLKQLCFIYQHDSRINNTKLCGLCQIWGGKKRTLQNKTVQTTVEYSWQVHKLTPLPPCHSHCYTIVHTRPTCDDILYVSCACQYRQIGATVHFKSIMLCFTFSWSEMTIWKILWVRTKNFEWLKWGNSTVRYDMPVWLYVYFVGDFFGTRKVNSTCRKMMHRGMMDKGLPVLKKCRSPLGGVVSMCCHSTETHGQ